MSCPINACKRLPDGCKERERDYLSVIVWPCQCRTSFSHSPKLWTLHSSSYTIQALDCDLIYNTSLNAFNGGSANSWPSSQQDSGFIFMPGWRHSAGRLIYSHAVLYLVSFDSSARLSSEPPRPLQASLALWRHTEVITFWNRSEYIWEQWQCKSICWIMGGQKMSDFLRQTENLIFTSLA